MTRKTSIPSRGGALPAISLFTGAGGLDLGFTRHAFEVRVAVEVDAAACATLRRNWPELGDRLIEQPLENVPTARLLHVAGLEVGEAAIVWGGPPCQPYC